ncbi:MAG TPA: hypothetical protein PK335_01585 [Draconibacterium sp.]|nr:hypothetical protein [Draconibacterium sp.]
MKRALSIFLLLLSFSQISAQFSEKNALFLSSEMFAGNYWSINMCLNYIYNEQYSFQLGVSDMLRKAKTQPADFSSGLFGVIGTFGLSQIHFDEMQNYQVLFGRIVKPKVNGTTRFNLTAGLAYTVINEPTNWQRVDDSYGLGANYTYEISTQNTISLVINPKIEFPFTRLFGLTVSPLLQINKHRTFIGVGAGFMLGLLRPQKI